MATTSPPPAAGELDPRLARSRAKVLGAATELLVEAGPRGLTVDAVAERSGVAKSTIYRHWESVQELLVDVMRSNVPPSPPVDLAAGFEATLHTWVAQGAENLSSPEWARILPVLLELRSHSPEMADLLQADFDAKLAPVAEILALGVAEGRLPSALDPRMVTQTLMGPLVLAALSGDQALVPALAEFVVERFLASYRNPGDPR
jgi:AcrR family transcriptional regulator